MLYRRLKLLFFSELSVALVEETLSDKVAKNISKCIKMYAVKTEQQLATGQEAANVIGSLSSNIIAFLTYLRSLQLMQTMDRDLTCNWQI